MKKKKEHNKSELTVRVKTFKVKPFELTVKMKP